MKNTSGYSTTPLARKLGLKTGHNFLLVDEPSHYRELFTDWPEGLAPVTNTDPESVDFIHLFTKEQAVLQNQLAELKPLLRKNGLLWISWPKGKSKIETDLNRELIREMGLSAGLVDVKVCAIDEDWSGLKFVYRVKDR
ncbi:MAG: DUF3052 domain-containing protein [Bacteroidota bacterium]